METSDESSETLIRMARLTVRTAFDACHGTSDVRHSSFGVAVTIEGPILGDFVAGVDDVFVAGRLHAEAGALRGKLLDDITGRATLENLASFFIARLADCSVDSVSVEAGPSKATCLSAEIDLETWPVELAFRRGVSLLLRGQGTSALEEFSRAIELAPRWAIAHNARGRCFRRLGHKERALADFESALRLDSEFGEAHRNKGNILLELNQAAESLSCFDRALELLPESALAYNNRGWALQMVSQYSRAVTDHERAVELDPSYAEAFQDLGAALEQLGRNAEARSAREEAKRLLPMVNQIQVERAKLYHSSCLRRYLAP